eukprot:CAMPEP_0183733056 /NCGR_PEP_ID=MMETSP0737-20130205/40049_1 /TAXON_ID=385413 /ORGANISM="Thalassiosira miniscula, Strain CCMP1093" /LENGTH=709 /DNA_ID=CAMNT_0025966229 /DNA_START=330 /DNA_END=2459 /DNA_ORIENTATION=+
MVHSAVTVKVRSAAAALIFLVLGNLHAFVVTAEVDTCAALANTPCSLLDDPSSTCGGFSCLGTLECAVTTGRCASIPRQYGEPCGVRDCDEGLRCSVTCGICIDQTENDLAPIPFDSFVTSESTETATACGMSSTRVFRNWAGTVRTDHPLIMPKDDAELKSILQKASAGGCTVRPAGSGHSAAGVVAEESTQSNVVVVSLVEYAPSDRDWAAVDLVASGGDEATVRIPGGSTQLKLYATIRPAGYFLPTQTAGWLFTIGGVLSNFVHGGVFGKGPVHNHLVSLRVMLWDGTIKILNDPDDLRFWRNGYGLLGIITAAEFMVVRRPDFWFGTLPLQPPQGGWNAGSFQAYIDGIKAEYSAAEFFLNPHNKDILAVVQKDRPPVTPVSPSISDSACTWSWWNWQCEPPELCSYQYRVGDWTTSDSCRAAVQPTPTSDDQCTWDYLSFSCRHPEHCSYQFQLGDLTLEESCRLTIPPPPSADAMAEAYRRLLIENELLGVNGVPIGDDRLQQDAICLASRVGLETILVDQVMQEIPRLVRDASERTMDGFFVGETIPLPTPLIGYLVPADKLFAVLDAIAKLDYALSSPIEWRYVTFNNDDDDAVLHPGNLRSGEWAAVECVSIEIPGWTPDEWRQNFLDFEQTFKDAGGVPHVGKYFGMGVDDTGLIQPFQNVEAGSLYEESQIMDFRTYAGKVDPNGLFRSGFMADHIF